MANPWSKREQTLICRHYLKLLKWEQAGEKLKKTEQRNLLLPRLNDRTPGSYELKMQNISAAIVDAGGHTWIKGYKRLPGYQRSLCEVMQRVAPDLFGEHNRGLWTHPDDLEL